MSIPLAVKGNHMVRKLCALTVIAVSLTLVSRMSVANESGHALKPSGILIGSCEGRVLSQGSYLVGLGGTSDCSYATGLPPLLIPMPSDGGLSHLVVNALSPYNGSGPAVLTLMVNGSATALTCTLPAGNPNQQISCTDKEHLVRIHTGDSIGVWISVDSTSTSPVFVMAALDRVSRAD
jgi:hypothetical protein